MGVLSHLKGKLENKLESKLEELRISHNSEQQQQHQQQQQQPVNQNYQQSYNETQYASSKYDRPPASAPEIPSRDYVKSSNKRFNLGSTNEVFTDDLFSSPISNQPPVSQIPQTATHPVKLPERYKSSSSDIDRPIQTNNFYGNFLVDEQNLPVWTHPYSVWQSKDDQFKGLAISHTSNAQKVFGDDPASNPVKYFFNPVAICSIVLGALEFQNESYTFKVGELERFSCGLNWQLNNRPGSMTSHILQGMGFITVVYENTGLTPAIGSKVGFQNFESCGKLGNNGNDSMWKFICTLFDGVKWVVFSNKEGLTMRNPNLISMNSNSDKGTIIQVAKLTNGDVNQYDLVAGSYPTAMSLFGQVNASGESAKYGFKYQTSGGSQSGETIQWALPHQYLAFDECMNDKEIKGMVLDSTCKGVMKAYCCSEFVMAETLPSPQIQFDPWSETKGFTGYSKEALDKIRQVAETEVGGFDVINASNTDSMYTAGKILDKGAFMLFVVARVLKDAGLTKTFLEKMKTAFERFISNRQQSPLAYETNWKGIVSTAGLKDGNFYCDFGNCFYNDHHFHYGYHIHAAALVCLVDREFGDGSFYDKCKDWIETLIRDVANPSTLDKYFPVFRSFDFYNGHSFANGLFAHGDGKDEESSSEDYHCYYGIKLWGMVTGNDQLEKIGSLILAIEKRAMNLYMLYTSDNTTVPDNFKANKVSGILFENKIDHATYFGMNKEYIHGIHMLPTTPISSYIRSSRFIMEEWNDMKLGDLVQTIDDGWKGILMLNLADADPQTSWKFFSSDQFQERWLDNGMSRTWSLALCAGVGGCP
ncbi:glycoside hydrolase family 81 protein [[Candida] arabinofermentans NRRL YB-2248]|uniref:glucan endo-1,3-beta-D-glucosidase n=1 Tax=[Candida] arabinofermentans NRRL YB-2248 TaxID=983967 RepID=A0A1E4T1E1_9ASCO|nr:glycoside hydrolase family 81 protein [[Candida] arabinofermentans NRRL YB-2248]